MFNPEAYMTIAEQWRELADKIERDLKRRRKLSDELSWRALDHRTYFPLL